MKPGAGRATAFLLFAVFLALFWFGNGAHGLWDADEPRYAQATREMLVSGDFISPTFNGEDRFQKPVLIYWLMAIPMGLFGEGEFTARAVSGISGALSVSLLFCFALQLGCGRREALAVAVMTGLYCLFLLVSKAAVIDATLTVMIVAIMLLLWRQLTLGFSPERHIGIWALLGLSILLKGPPGPVIVGLAVLVYWIWNRWRPVDGAMQRAPMPQHLVRWVSGFLVVLAICLSWGIAIGLRSNWEFYSFAVGDQVGERITTAKEGHEGPFFFYLLVLLPALFPFTGLFVASLRWSIRQARTPAMRYLWCWIVPSFIAFSVISTKLPHYILPLLPAMGLMMGLWLVQVSDAEDNRLLGWWKAGAIITWVVGGLIGFGLPVGAVLGRIPGLLLPAIIVAMLLLATSAIGGLEILRTRVMRAFAVLATGWVLAMLVILTWALPTLDAVRPSRNLTRWIHENAPAGAHYIAADYKVSSLPFNYGQPVEMVSNARPGRTAVRMREEPVWVMTITRHRWNKWLEEDAEDDSWSFPDDIQEKTAMELFNAERGKWQEFVILGNW
jgi:4-amino-4-deoxy-L-arabinose transferase-like glycosyltransferase